VLGRHGEEPGSLLARLSVERQGAPLLRNDLAVGPRWPGSLGPAGVGPGTRAVGTVVVVGPDAGGLTIPPRPGVRAAVLPLAADDAVLVTAVGTSAGAVSALLDDVLMPATCT
jgi:urease accessory protein